MQSTHRSQTTQIRTCIVFWIMYKIYRFMQCAPDLYEFFQSIFGLRPDAVICPQRANPSTSYLRQRSNMRPVCVPVGIPSSAKPRVMPSQSIVFTCMMYDRLLYLKYFFVASLWVWHYQLQIVHVWRLQNVPSSAARILYEQLARSTTYSYSQYQERMSVRSRGKAL